MESKIWWLVGMCSGFTLFGAWLGWELWGRDAVRWQWWRQRYMALCRTDCASRVGLDLTRIHVQSPHQMDAVTDAAMRKPPNVCLEPTPKAVGSKAGLAGTLESRHREGN